MRRKYWIILSCAAAVIIALAVWGFQERKMKNTITIHAENHYQQAFHELTHYVDSLEESLGMSLAMRSRETMRPQLVETWRLSALAHAAANELPLTLLPFNRTNEFLSHVGEFTYHSGVKSENNRPVTDKEYGELQKLYQESITIRDGLREVQGKVMSDRLRWMDVEWALKSKKQNQDNQLIDGMKKVDGQATDYTQSFSPENPKNIVLEKKKLKTLTGKKIDKKEAINTLKKWTGLSGAKVDRVSETRKGSNVDAFEISLKSSDGHTVSGAVTKRGGHIVWFMSSRPIGKGKISLHDAAEHAAQYLNKRSFKAMAVTKRDQYNQVAVMTFVQKRGNVFIYPASLRVKVALDNGEIIAFDQTDFLYNKYDDISLSPKLSEKTVAAKLNDNMNIQESRLVIFQDQKLQNILCYEFFATKGDDTYRILFNATTGDQEKVELLGS